MGHWRYWHVSIFSPTLAIHLFHRDNNLMACWSFKCEDYLCDCLAFSNGNDPFSLQDSNPWLSEVLHLKRQLLNNGFQVCPKLEIANSSVFRPSSSPWKNQIRRIPRFARPRRFGLRGWKFLGNRIPAFQTRTDTFHFRPIHILLALDCQSHRHREKDASLYKSSETILRIWCIHMTAAGMLPLHRHYGSKRTLLWQCKPKSKGFIRDGCLYIPVLFVFPIIAVLHLAIYRNRRETFKDSIFAQFYDGIKLTKKCKSMYTLIVLISKFSLILGIILMPETVFATRLEFLIFFQGIALYFSIFIRPFEDKKEQIMDIIYGIL